MLPLILLPELSSDVRSWLENVLGADDLPGCRAKFSSVDAIVAPTSWEPSPRAREFLVANRLEWLPVGATHRDLVRILLLSHAIDRTCQPFNLVERWFRHACVAERRTLMRSLSLLPRPKQFLHFAVDAATGPNDVLFEAVACDNPYPGTYFSDGTFDVVVDRVMAMGLDPRRVHKIAERSKLKDLGSIQRHSPRSTVTNQ
jgi:hypothetical protein